MPTPGTLIEGKYEILSKIREGGMGAIYMVRHRLLDEIRVIKVMRPHLGAESELKERFTQEAKTVTKLKHPNIGSVLDFALDSDGTAYIVMEYIDGVNLADLIKTSGPPTLPLTLDIMHQTLLALAYLHRRNIVHRDIAPDNLMLTLDEDHKTHVKLIDLGIAKALDKTIELTSTGVFLGKVKYCSPEQLGGLPKGETLDGRSDLYSLGVVFYEMCTGMRPFTGETPRELFAAHMFKSPIPFAESDPTGRVPDVVRTAILKALEKKREDRYASADEFDREIVMLRTLFDEPLDRDSTVRLLTKARMTPQRIPGTFTPSAQDRLNRQFAPQTTPISSIESSRTVDPTVTYGEPTVLAAPASAPTPVSPGTVAVPPATVVVPPRPKRRLLPGLLGGIAAASLIVLAVTLLRQRPERVEPGPKIEPTAAPSPVATVAPTPGREPTQRIEPTPALTAPTDQTASQFRPAAVQARGRASSARQAAEGADAPRLAAKIFERARAKETEGQRLFQGESYAEAQRNFAIAADLFGRAEQSAIAQSSRPVPPTPVVIASRETPRHETIVHPLPTTVPPEPIRPTPIFPSDGGRTTAADDDRIRETIREFVKAQNMLDVDLYLRVYPGLAPQRARLKESFGGLRSQEVKFELSGIEHKGPGQAVVRGHQTIRAFPKIGGNEQNVDRNVVVSLEKRPEGWVITNLR